jgi:FkbM family methyltransferase
MKTLIFLVITSLFHLSIMCDEPYPWRYEGVLPHSHSLEENVLATIYPWIRNNPVILEAGAHYGEDSRNFAKIWPEATVLCFEPNPNAFKKLVESTKDYPGILPVNLALADYNGEGTLHLCYGSNGNEPRFEGASSLLEASEGMKIHYQGPDITVPCAILDDWCFENSIDKVDFMWLDLEGVELQVLKSSPKILKKVHVIFAETNFQYFRHDMTQYSDLKEFLENQGFTLMSHWYREGLQGNALFLRR